MINHQVVEPTRCIGSSSSVTNTTLAIASVLPPQDYSKFAVFKELWVDNGAFEIGVGQQVDFDIVLDKQIAIANRHAELGLTTFFSMPDAAGNGAATIRLFHQYYNYVTDHLNDRVALVGIPQGSNLNEYWHCANILAGNNIEWWGLSCLDRRWIYKTAYYSNPEHDIFEDFFTELCVNPKMVHCLGFELDDIERPGFFKCNSFDSSYSLKCLATNRRFGQDAKRPENYFDLCFTEDLIKTQVTNFINWVAVKSKTIGENHDSNI